MMDEPTSALSEGDKERPFTFIERMTAEGIAIIYISHHMPEISGIADRVTVMRDGQVVLSETTADSTEDVVIHSMTCKELGNFVKPYKQIADEVRLSVNGLSKPGAVEER
ncbi:MAG: sugar ABC transporter ATP-binding protein, partial [Geminicoccaceae bacterium]